MQIVDLPASHAARLIPLLQELHGLHAAQQPARYPAKPKDDTLQDWLQTWLQEDKLTTLVAESPQGALLGYVIYGLEHRPALPVRFEENRLMIHHICVAAPFRRMGIGLALMSVVKQRAQAQGVDAIATTYAPFNIASAALFQSLGLEPALTFAEWRA